MRKILITGGAGNVGSALTNELLKDSGTHVVVVDNLSTGRIEHLNLNHPQLNFMQADANDFDQLAEIMREHSFDYVFHYAAVVGVKRTQQNPIQVLRDIDGFKHMLTLSNETGVKRFYFSSSSEVYGEPVTIPQHEETTPLNSRVPYAVVKNVGESYCRSFFQEYGLNYTIFRFFNTYGPHQTIDFVVSKFLVKAIKGEDITIYGDGSQTRTFCYVEDNIEACVRALDEGKFENDVVNIGHETIISVKELAQLIIRIAKSSSKIAYLPPLKDGDMTRRQPDNAKMKTILGRELVSLEEGIQKMLRSEVFLKNNGIDPDLIKHLID